MKNWRKDNNIFEEEFLNSDCYNAIVRKACGGDFNIENVNSRLAEEDEMRINQEVLMDLLLKGSENEIAKMKKELLRINQETSKIGEETSKNAGEE